MPYLLNKTKEFVEKMKDPRERKYFSALLGGKLLGVVLTFVVMFLFSYYVGGGSKARAQETPAKEAPAASAPATPAPPAAAEAPKDSSTPAAPAAPAAPADASAPAAPPPPNPP